MWGSSETFSRLVTQKHARCADSTSDVAMWQYLKGGGAAQGRQDGRAQDHEVHACQAPRLCRCACFNVISAVSTGPISTKQERRTFVGRKSASCPT